MVGAHGTRRWAKRNRPASVVSARWLVARASSREARRASAATTDQATGVGLVLHQPGERPVAAVQAGGELVERPGGAAHVAEQLPRLLGVAGELSEHPLAAVDALEDLLERRGRRLHVRHRALQVDQRRLAQLAVAEHGAEQPL